MNPKIIIVIHYLEIGGAETSLIGLLNALDYTKIDVDLFIYRHTGELMSAIPKEVCLLPENPTYSMVEAPMKVALKQGHIGVVLARLWAEFQFVIYSWKAKPLTMEPYYYYMEKALSKVLPSLAKYGEYDLAINFLGMPCVVLDKIKAQRKVNWIHTDYSSIAVNQKNEEPRWLQFDNIVSISKEVTKTFIQVFPHTASKIIEIENILSPLFVRQQADLYEVKAEMPDEPDVVKILTIGRFSPPKKIEGIPHICAEMERLGADFRWYVIGYGPDREIQEALDKYGMRHRMKLLGKKSNPYPYIKACDIYAQPSIYEGKSVTVREAQILCKPVVITDYPTAKSQITHGVDGVIVPLDEVQTAMGIVDFINNGELRNKIVSHLHTHDFGNEIEVEKIYSLIHDK